MLDDNLIVIGKFSSSFGIKGLVKFLSYSEEIDHLHDISEVQIVNTTYQIEYWLMNSPTRCKVMHINTPEEVSAVLSGKEVQVARQFASKLGTDEYYLADLNHITVLYNNVSQGMIVGVITDAYSPLFEIKWLHSNKRSYIPFIKEYFTLPNLEHRTITLLIEDFIEKE